MKAIIVIDIDGDHLHKESMELYERLKGYKCELRPMPQKTGQKPFCKTKQECVNLGWDACVDTIMGETETSRNDLSTDEGWWRDYELYEMQTD